MFINIQLIIIISYFLLLILIGIFTRKLSKTSSDYLIAGRNLGLVLCTVSITGEWLGGMSTVGTAEKAYATGFFPIWYNISTAIGMVLFGLTLAAKYRKNNVHTVGEMLEKLYSRRVRIIVSICFAIAFIILTYIQLQTVGGVAAQVLGVSYKTAVIISSLLIILYVYYGGMKSIALTNLLHVILLYSTLLTVFILVLIKMGGYSGLFGKLEAVLPAAQAAAFKNPLSLGYGKVISWLLGGILAGFASQASIQPVFAAKDIKTAKRAAFLSALFIAPIGILVSTLGMAVRTGAFGGPPPTVKETLPFLLMNSDFLPSWLSGLAMAGILAAILSTVAPVMFAVSTILTRDVYYFIFNRNASDKKLLSVSRKLLVTVGFIAIPPAIFFKGGILDTAYITYAIRGSAAIAVLLGVFHFRKLFPPPSPLSINVAMINASIASVAFVLFKKELTLLLGFSLDKVYAAIFFTLISIILVTWWGNRNRPGL